MTERQAPPTDAVASGRRILEEEARAILRTSEQLGEAFSTVVETLLDHRGRVALTGVGKSGTIGEKIAATFASTGTPAFYLRPVEALHGDLGMLCEGDVLMPISASGETAEVLAVTEAARTIGARIIALTGNGESALARSADLWLDVGVEREVCPLGLAPTASTTVTLAVGDALAMVLSERRGFTRENFLRFHPGGSLGERLRHLVRDLMRSGESMPKVEESATVGDTLDEMTRRDNLGLSLVVDRDGRLRGIITDGDIRRAVLAARDSAEPGAADSLLAEPVSSFMGRRPKLVEPEASAADALRLMEVHGITALAVVDPHGRPQGIVHLHDILGRGQFRL